MQHLSKRINKEQIKSMIAFQVESKPDLNVFQQFKLMILGSSFVGKTCIIQRAIFRKFNPNYQVTIGADCCLYDIDIDGKIICLQVWDTAGQEAFYSLTKLFYKNSSLILIVFDLTSASSFASVAKWSEEIKQNASEKVIQILVGNKNDQIDNIVISDNEIHQSIIDNQFDGYISVSAKSGENIQELFLTISKILYNNFMQDLNRPSKISEMKLESQNSICGSSKCEC